MLTLANQTIFFDFNNSFFLLFAIKDVVLKAKEEIIDNGDKCEDDFGDVESVLDWETSTGHGEYASDQIQDYAGNRPSLGAFSFVVPVGWRCVFYQGYD